ncbi:MAG: two-component system response regulator [Magnetovibrio sp.]|nr:two-component system response regulator [Magnetovibrio sp.]|tara:strand:+ start:148 stop:513 length:366 start_codon:yes stop_codon:yes gene_type:complete
MPKTIFLVEDDKLNMKLFNDLLQVNGYNTVQSIDGRDFLNMVRDNKPDLILMDIKLREISGLDLIKMLKKEAALNAIPVVAVTAFTQKQDKIKIQESGCDAYIDKPVSVQKLLDTVSEFLG